MRLLALQVVHDGRQVSKGLARPCGRVHQRIPPRLLADSSSQRCALSTVPCTPLVPEQESALWQAREAGHLQLTSKMGMVACWM